MERQTKHLKTEGGVSNEEELEIFITTYSSCICIDYAHILLFYRFDNKYTARGDQAIQGILYVPDDDSVHYLAREWEYYPDVLLTPQEIKEQKEDYYSRYVSIGEYGGMDLGDKNKSPFGSGTYRMTLVLPEKEKQYAIGLTEIFSAYKLYINGELMGQMGNPDPDNYQE